MVHSKNFRTKARTSWRPLILIFVLLFLAGSTFLFVKATFADRLELLKDEIKHLQVIPVPGAELYNI